MTSLRTRILSIGDLRQVTDRVGLDRLLDELITRLRDALNEHDPTVIETHDRAGFQYDKPDLGLIEWMPSLDTGRVAAIKVVGYHPTNPVQRRLPSILATTSLYDTTNGRLMVVAEATLLTALRTGAATAVATDALAIEGPITLGVVGCGAQAVAQIHGISRVRSIQRLVVTDADLDVAATLGGRLPDVGIEPEVVDAARFASTVADLDVLTTCTSVDIGAGPVVDPSDHRPWLHVNAVGADFPGKTELPRPFLDSAVVVPDVVGQCLAEGESQQLLERDLGPDLVSVVQSNGTSARLRTQTTVFDSTGWSLEDLVAIELFDHHADRLGLGTLVDLQYAPDDPYDPYEVVRDRPA